MKRLAILTLLILGCFQALYGQNSASLPVGTKPLSNAIYIAPNADVWTGKAGLYINMAKKRYVDSLINAYRPIPSALSVSSSGLAAGEYRMPSVTSASAANSWQNFGAVASASRTGNGLNGIALRTNGRINIANGTLPDHAVNKRQLDSMAAAVVVPAYSDQTVSSSVASAYVRSRIMNSSASNMTASYVGNPTNNFIVASNRANIVANRPVRNLAIIASDSAYIHGGRIQTAIIASSNVVVEEWPSSTSLKWNSAAIATLNGRIQSSNSYVLLTGQGTISNGSAQIVGGLYNVQEPSRSVTDPLKKVFILGNGGNTAALERSNAFYVTHGGNAWVQNEFEVDKAGGGVILKAPNGTRWRVTVSNTGQLTTTQVN